MSTPAQVTEAHRALHNQVIRAWLVDVGAQLIADSEARVVADSDLQVQKVVEETDALRAEVQWLKESDQKNQMICLDVMRERDEQRVRAERAEAELAREREKCRVLRDGLVEARSYLATLGAADLVDNVLAATGDNPT